MVSTTSTSYAGTADRLGGGDHERAVGSRRDGDVADAALEESATGLREVVETGQTAQLLVVGQEVVDVGERVGHPRQHVGVAGGEQVHRRDGAVGAGVRQQPAGGLAAEELRPAQVQQVGGGDGVEVHVVEGEGPVGADAVPGRPVAVGAHRQHAGRGLLVTLDEAGDVDAVGAQQRAQHLAGRVAAGRADAGDVETQLRQHDGGPAGGAGGGQRDALDELTVGALGDALDVAHVHVEHVDADGEDPRGGEIGGGTGVAGHRDSSEVGRRRSVP